ncbi:MAG: hypothetical protein HQK83_03250 [Fibrobacteria bacterium]|nr:hypothetical protein [Fibrobacteria bacterium]
MNKRLLVLVALFSFLLLSGCAPMSKPNLLTGDKVSRAMQDKWKSYGAYYNVDELFIETSYLTTPLTSNPVTRYIINKKIKILTNDGAQYGSLKIPVYSRFIKKFNVIVRDSNNIQIPVPVAKLKSMYKKEGKVIIPRVTKGCEIEILIESSTQSPLMFLEHYFSQPIPVKHARFTLSALSKYNYAFNSYGAINRHQKKPVPNKKNLDYYIWNKQQVLPRSRLRYQQGIDVTEPRVSLVMRSYQTSGMYGQMDAINSWEDLTEGYKNILLKQSFFKSTSKLRNKVDEITAPFKSQYVKADAIFHWVQENISYVHSRMNPINPDKVIKNGKGNLWEMAVILSEMFKHIKLDPQIYVTRPHSYGGFDMHFITPAVLSVPLVSVTIFNKEYLVFPYSRGAKLGEYPLNFFDLPALSLKTGMPRMLPPSASGPSYKKQHVIVDLTPDELGDSEIKINLEYGGVFAYQKRNSFLDMEKKDIAEVFQKYISELGTSNRLKTHNLETLNDRGKALKSSITFSNSQQVISRKGKTQFRLSHIFNAYLTTYDTTRITKVYNGFETDLEESVEFILPTDKKVDFDISCTDVSNSLFTVKCETKNEEGRYLFTRKLTMHKVLLDQARMKRIVPDIRLLNTINDSKLTLEDI